MANRKAISQTADPRVRQVILDTAATQFPAAVIKVAQSMIAQGDPVYGASCVGVGKGSRKWNEEKLKALEIGVVGDFARGCQAGGIARQRADQIAGHGHIITGGMVAIIVDMSMIAVAGSVSPATSSSTRFRAHHSDAGVIIALPAASITGSMPPIMMMLTCRYRPWPADAVPMIGMVPANIRSRRAACVRLRDG